MPDQLNLRHLQYFYVISREGSIVRASEILDLAPQTLSGQLATFETAVGGRLFRRERRSLVLTDLGRMVYGYAEDIFATTAELNEALRQPATERPTSLSAGVSASIHKLIAYHLLQPAFTLDRPVSLHCQTGRTADLLLALKRQELDVVLTDRMPHLDDQTRLTVHPIMRSTISLFASPALAGRLRDDFPASLEGEPFLANATDAPYYDQLINWFSRAGIRMRLVAQIDDSALIKVFGREGVGVFAAPTAISAEVCRQYEVEAIASIDAVSEDLFAVTRGRTILHDGVRAICRPATLFN
ncbi:LysR family transcriptional regulator [Allohahella sp. A8]|uniref:LysR family transcriptional regulator n=1 Tax=Allohahella sp. A8 TaxID=3141461 RepID=UPI003A8040F1